MVAIRIESKWGTYLVLSEFARVVEVEGVRFQGKFGILCPAGGTESCLLAVGTRTLRQGTFGFSGAPSRWRGRARSNTDTVIEPADATPADWPALPSECGLYVLVYDGRYRTGFPVERIDGRSITVKRFPCKR